MNEMDYGRWNEWDALWEMNWIGWTLFCEHNKYGVVVRQCDNINTTEVEYTHKQDGWTRLLLITPIT